MWYFIGGTFVGFVIGYFACALMVMAKQSEVGGSNARAKAFCEKILGLENLKGKKNANWLIEEAQKILDGD